QVGAHVDEIDADAVALGRLLAEADGADLQAAARAIKPEIAGDRGGENEQKRDRNETDAGLEEVDEILADHAERRGPQIKRYALHDAEHGDGGDDGIDADIANQRAVDQPDHDAGGKAHQGAEKNESRTKVFGNQKRADHHRQADDRADRDIKA